MAKKCVKVHWDRKKLAAKRGHGYIELSIYLGAGERKFVNIGSANAIDWIRIQHSKEIQDEVEKYEAVVRAMRDNGEEMTVANLDTHLEVLQLISSSKKSKKAEQESCGKVSG